VRSNNLNITNTLIKPGGNLNIVDAMGHMVHMVYDAMDFMVLYLEFNIFKFLKHDFLNLN
jgi:hypothetical protein